MRRAALLFACVSVALLCSAPSRSATVVQHKSCVVVSSATGTCAFTSPNIAGDTLLYISGFENVGGIFTSISAVDSASNTVTAIDSVIGTAFSGDRVALASWWVNGCASGSNTVTFSTSIGTATNRYTIVIIELSGLQASALDVHSIAPFSTAGPTVSTSITTPGPASDFVVGYGYADNGTGGYILACSNTGGTNCTGGNFVVVDTANDTGTTRETTVSQVSTSATAGTYTMSMSSNTSGAARLVGAIAFKVQLGSSTVAGPSTTSGPSTRNP